MTNTIHSPAGTAEALQKILLESPDFEEFLDQLVAHSAATLSGYGSTSYVMSITVERRHRRTTVATSGGEALHLDEIQYGEGDGPCLHALRTGETVLIHEVATDSRWRSFLKAVGEAGVGSILALPIPLESETLAALNCYASEPHAFPPAAVLTAEGYAAIAAKALLLAARLDSHVRRAADLQSAMESRTIIDLAVGIVMGQNNCDQESAVDILRRASNTRNVKLREVATAVVAAVSGRAVTHFDS